MGEEDGKNIGEQETTKKGPLHKLTDKKYKAKFLQYPLNLESAEEKHWVRFDIQEIIGAKIKGPQPRNTSEILNGDSNLGLGGSKDSLLERATSAASEKASAAVDTLKNAPLKIAKSASGEFLNGLPPVLGGIGKKLLGGGKSRSRGLGSIMIYAPHSRIDGITTTWNTEAVGLIGAGMGGGVSMDNESVKSVIANRGMLLKDFISNVAGAAVGNQSIKNIINKADGHARNPHLEMFFSQIELRKFSFEFYMAPRNAPEAKAIREIGSLFKYAAAPKLEDGAGGIYFRYPNVFDITFSNQDQTHKIAQCAMESVAIDHSAANINSTFYDGYPTETKITVNFSELEIMHKDKIDEGY